MKFGTLSKSFKLSLCLPSICWCLAFANTALGLNVAWNTCDPCCLRISGAMFKISDVQFSKLYGVFCEAELTLLVVFDKRTGSRIIIFGFAVFF